MNDRTRRRAALALLTVAGLATAAAPPGGAETSRAACVAVLTHDPAIGAPGAAQRSLHWNGFGGVIADIAHQPKGGCAFPYAGADR